ncbi:MAG: response regulator [Thermodesulfobacteriota bacterium]
MFFQNRRSAITITALPKNVLVSDADPSRNLHLAILLKRLEYNVFVASNPPDLFRVANSVMPNMILLDLRMPIFEGQTCLERLRSNHRFDYVKVVTVSDAIDSDLLQESVKRGADASLTRPVSVTELYSTIQRLTENRPRKIPRLRVLFKVTLLAGKTGLKAFATMISERGVFVRTLHPVKKGTEVRLTLDLPSSKPLVLDGRVIYEVHPGEDRFVEPGMGVLFTDVAGEVAHGLRRFIEEHLAGDLETDTII